MRQFLWTLLGIASGVAAAFLLDDHNETMLAIVAMLGAFGIVTGIVTDRVDNAGFLSLGIHLGVVACFAVTMGLALGGGGYIIGFGIGVLFGLPAGIIVFTFAGLTILLKRHLMRRKTETAEPSPK